MVFPMLENSVSGRVSTVAEPLVSLALQNNWMLGEASIMTCQNEHLLRLRVECFMQVVRAQGQCDTKPMVLTVFLLNLTIQNKGSYSL